MKIQMKKSRKKKLLAIKRFDWLQAASAKNINVQ